MIKENTLSACYIVRNEEKNLKDSLDSVKSLVNEIIIVDTGSEDNTLNVIRKWKEENKFNLKLYHYKWNDNFAKARNYSISKATCDYILIIDADEWIEQSEHTKIKEVLGRYDIYLLKQHNILKDNQKLIVKHNRIFRNNGKILYSRASHEDINKIGFTEYDINAEIMHNGYLMTEKEVRAKVNRNIELHIKQLYTEPDNPMPSFYLARCYMQTKDYDLAGSFACLSLICKDLPNDHKSQLCILLHDVWMKKQNPFLAIQYLARAIDLVPKQRRGRWGLAKFYESAGKYQEAIKELEYILSINNIDTDFTGDLIINETQITNNINLIKEKQNANL